MTLSLPPPGGATLISLSRPAGGQMTPLDRASLSLSGSSLGGLSFGGLSLGDLNVPSPSVGGSPVTSGGHVTALPDGASRGDWAMALDALQVATIIVSVSASRVLRIAHLADELLTYLENASVTRTVPRTIIVPRNDHKNSVGNR
jgi:hypothetical protein